jgi:hypothetical protein
VFDGLTFLVYHDDYRNQHQHAKMNNGSQTGSQIGNAALTTLATELGMSVPALQRALEDAFDLVQQYIGPRMAFHLALTRLGYNIDGKVLYAILDRFGSIFANVFDNRQGKQE